MCWCIYITFVFHSPCSIISHQRNVYASQSCIISHHRQCEWLYVFVMFHEVLFAKVNTSHGALHNLCYYWSQRSRSHCPLICELLHVFSSFLKFTVLLSDIGKCGPSGRQILLSTFATTLEPISQGVHCRQSLRLWNWVLGSCMFSILGPVYWGHLKRTYMIQDSCILSQEVELEIFGEGAFPPPGYAIAEGRNFGRFYQVLIPVYSRGVMTLRERDRF